MMITSSLLLLVLFSIPMVKSTNTYYAIALI